MDKWLQGRRCGVAAMALGVMWMVGCCNTNLHYKILADRGTGMQAKFPEEPFQTGERIRFWFKSDHDCYVYLLNKATTGAYNVLMPHPRIRAGDNMVRGNEEIILPDPRPMTATQFPKGFAFDFATGSEELVIVGSRHRIPELDRFGPGARVPIDVMDRLLNVLTMQGESQRAKERRHPSTKIIDLDKKGPQDCSAVIVHRVVIRHERRAAPGAF